MMGMHISTDDTVIAHTTRRMGLGIFGNAIPCSSKRPGRAVLPGCLLFGLNWSNDRSKDGSRHGVAISTD
jgi:hypothetical protein